MNRCTHHPESFHVGAVTTWGVALLGLAAACSSSSMAAMPSQPPPDPDVARASTALGAGDWAGALAGCQAAEKTSPASCDGKYCEFVARSMLVVDQINSFLLPRYRRPLTPMPGDVENLAKTNTLVTAAITAGEAVTQASCEFELAKLPLLIGEAADPVVRGEVRGRWTTRDAHVMTALFDSISYGLQAEFMPRAVPPPPAGETTPALPPLLDAMRQHLIAEDAALFAQKADPNPADPRGGWNDRNGNGVPDAPDELLIDIFEPGTNTRIFDFSGAEFVKGEVLPAGVLTPTAALAPARCGYTQFHVTELAGGADTSSTDGMTFSPASDRVAIPLQVEGRSQIHTMALDGANKTCLTCGQPGNNDGVRWRPVSGDAIVFISDRDHKYATGNAGGGFGQELYAMRPDGTQPTRLTTSHAWATNYHVNFSPDGQHIVWGSTDAYAWDVMVADFVSDAQGMRLTNTRRIVHDTTWWETHGFTPDNRSVITTNTRAGFQSTDLYAIDIATGGRTRLTTSPAWDEHAHLSPDGRELAWITGRWHPASVLRLNDGAISPVFDFLWIIPGIFFEFLNAPAGYTSELTLMDADGANIHQLTDEKQVVADSQWSADGKKIVFRESNPADQSTRIRLLTFDDCQ